MPENYRTLVCFPMNALYKFTISEVCVKDDEQHSGSNYFKSKISSNTLFCSQRVSFANNHIHSKVIIDQKVWDFSTRMQKTDFLLVASAQNHYKNVNSKCKKKMHF